MKVQFFTIAPNTDTFSVEQQKLNDFLETVKFVKSATHFVEAEVGYWSVMIHYEDKKNPVATIKPSEQELNEQQTVILKKLKQWRSQKSIELNVPVYLVFHNSTLVHIAQSQPADTTELKFIKGVGQSKVDKYGDEVMRLLQQDITEVE